MLGWAHVSGPIVSLTSPRHDRFVQYPPLPSWTWRNHLEKKQTTAILLGRIVFHRPFVLRRILGRRFNHTTALLLIIDALPPAVVRLFSSAQLTDSTRRYFPETKTIRTSSQPISALLIAAVIMATGPTSTTSGPLVVYVGRANGATPAWGCLHLGDLVLLGHHFWSRLSAALPYLVSPLFSFVGRPVTANSPPGRAPTGTQPRRNSSPAEPEVQNGFSSSTFARDIWHSAAHALEPGHLFACRRRRSQIPTANSVPQMQVHARRKPEIVNACPVSPLEPNPFASPGRSMDEHPERLHPDAGSHQ